MKLEENYDLECDTNSSAISLHNLFSNKEFKAAYLSEDKEKVEKLLYSIGVDLEYGWCIVDRLHRPLGSNEVVQGGVMLYMERVDDEWLRGGCASMEALIRGTKDPSVRSEMLSMQDTYINTEYMIEKIKRSLK